MTKLIDKNLQNYRARIEEIIKDLHEMCIRIGHDELAKTVSDLRNRIHEPFMFVIVGEVKAGKSSFINALLATGREITKVAPQPMTDTIQQILYGETEEIITINEYLRKIILPVDILKEIAIVDTPGTNTIIEHHQEITESFIPASDLIVFVFEAKNPYRQSAWDFFNFIHEDWRRKIIFVLQQKDLMNEQDLEVNMQGVRDYATQRGISDPKIFAVSAKQEQEGQEEISGFKPMRDYISANITGGKAPLLKLHNNVATSLNIHERIQTGLDTRAQQLEADIAFRKDITETLDHQEVLSKKQVDVLVENLIASYDRVTLKKENELRSGLSFLSLLKRSFSSIFNRKASVKDWLDDLTKSLEDQLNLGLRQKLDDGINDLAESIQQMAKIIDLKIRNSETILRNDHEIFSDIGERRSNILNEVKEAFSAFIQQSENFTDDELFPDKKALSPNLATGGGMAVIGIILATVTQTVVFDITGGILTTIGLLFAGVSTRVKRNKILEGFRAEIDKGRHRIEQEVTEKLKIYIEHLKERIDRNFVKFDQMLEIEKEQIGQLQTEHQSTGERLMEIQEELSVN